MAFALGSFPPPQGGGLDQPHPPSPSHSIPRLPLRWYPRGKRHGQKATPLPAFRADAARGGPGGPPAGAALAADRPRHRRRLQRCPPPGPPPPVWADLLCCPSVVPCGVQPNQASFNSEGPLPWGGVHLAPGGLGLGSGAKRRKVFGNSRKIPSDVLSFGGVPPLGVPRYSGRV